MWSCQHYCGSNDISQLKNAPNYDLKTLFILDNQHTKDGRLGKKKANVQLYSNIYKYKMFQRKAVNL